MRLFLKEAEGAKGTAKEGGEPGGEWSRWGEYACETSRLESGGVDTIVCPSHGSVREGGVGGQVPNVPSETIDPHAVWDKEVG
jgi:hypothetical protein